jgi:hypothetical protein
MTPPPMSRTENVCRPDADVVLPVPGPSCDQGGTAMHAVLQYLLYYGMNVADMLARGARRPDLSGLGHWVAWTHPPGAVFSAPGF